jgi:ABC transporter substrate binding protein (PQQ-dependent alcohol dehydrogenase system)
MVADALIQYLAWKRWNRAVLVIGRHANDRAYAESLKRAAKRFGVKIIEEKLWTAIPGARRTDSGHHTAQQEIPVFTRFKEHDVVLVADEADEFGEYLSYRATSPRPVAGTQGLLPTSWHRTQEQWGATQIQRRFEKLAARTMTERDYAAWAAMRSLGEAVTHTGSAAPADIKAFILSDKFKLAGFKGGPLTFRRWNGQLRQPVLLASPRMLVSVSPQKGYLHERSELDTLGFDKPESACQEFSE